ncbi:MAG: hypothetical protein GSR79_07735 [Desulfurococcales archaeon]|nr:hypothetical protein [Desulfurococcales archaeon]
MRLPVKRNGSDTGGQLCITLDDRLKGILKYYLNSTPKEKEDEALKELLEKGYRYWLLEKNYGKEKVGDRENWDPVYWSMKLASGFAFYKIRLRDAIEELKKLTMSLSGVLGDLKLCYEKPETVRRDPIFGSRIEEYQKEVNAYVEKFITALREDVDSSERYVEDEERFLDELESLIKDYRKLLREKRSVSKTHSS